MIDSDFLAKSLRQLTSFDEPWCLCHVDPRFAALPPGRRLALGCHPSMPAVNIVTQTPTPMSDLEHL